MKIEFIKDKETKNTIRFTATGEVSGSLYVAKDSELAKDSHLAVEVVASQPAEVEAEEVEAEEVEAEEVEAAEVGA